MDRFHEVLQHFNNIGIHEDNGRYRGTKAGRWHKPYRTPVEERKCVNCNSLKDEFHFVLECSLYQDLRQIYIKRYFWTRPNVPQFVELLQSDNKKIIKNFSVYIYKSFEKRTEFLSR